MFKVSLVIKTGKLLFILASLVAQLVKNPPAMHETLVWFLSWENPLEKGMATYSSILGKDAYKNKKSKKKKKKNLYSIRKSYLHEVKKMCCCWFVKFQNLKDWYILTPEWHFMEIQTRGYPWDAFVYFRPDLLPTSDQ